MKSVAKTTGFQSAELVTGDDPGFDATWGQVQEAIKKFRTRSCRHLKGPQMTFVRAWDKPFRLRCVMCELKDARPQGEEEFRCDICNTIEQEGFQMTNAQAGPFQIALGRCAECHSSKTAPQSPDAG